MTECSQNEFLFEAHFSRQVVGRFDGSRLTTDGGSLLLREVDRKICLLWRVAGCFTDARAPERIEHELPELLAQRIYGLPLDYEDLNDHEELRHDPWLAVLAGKRELAAPLAAKSTLNRLEWTPAAAGGRRAARPHHHRVSRAGAALAGDPGARPAGWPRGQTASRHRSDSVNPEAKVVPTRWRRAWVPPADYPWRQAARREEEQRAQPGAGRARVATPSSWAWSCASY